MKKTIAFFKLFSIAFLVILQLAPTGIEAKTFKKIRIIMPGNFGGNTFTYNSSYRAQPGHCWSIPKFIESLKKQKNYSDAVIDVGNNSSIYNFKSYISDAIPGNRLINFCNPVLSSLGPEDLGIFRNKPLDLNIRSKIWTNVSPSSKGYLFPPSKVIKLSDLSITVYSFISKDYLANFPMMKWGNIKVMSPSYALKRLMPVFKKNSINLIIAHLTDNDTKNLIARLNRYKGYFLFVRVAQQNISRLKSIPKTINNVYYFEIPSGANKLPILTLVRRNNGYPKINVKLVPIEKLESDSSNKLFAKISEEIFKRLNKIVKVVLPKVANPPFRFKPQVYSEFMRDYSRTDISVLKKPDSDFITDFIIRQNDIKKIGRNCFITKFRLKGYRLQNLILDLISHSKHELIFGGCSFRLLSGQIFDFKIRKQTLIPNRFYSISVTSNLLTDKDISPLFENLDYRRNDGITVWDIWKNKLPKCKISSDLLDN